MSSSSRKPPLITPGWVRYLLLCSHSTNTSPYQQSHRTNASSYTIDVSDVFRRRWPSEGWEEYIYLDHCPTPSTWHSPLPLGLGLILRVFRVMAICAEVALFYSMRGASCLCLETPKAMASKSPTLWSWLEAPSPPCHLNAELDSVNEL